MTIATAFDLLQSINEFDVDSIPDYFDGDTYRHELSDDYYLLFVVKNDDLTFKEIGIGTCSEWVRNDVARPVGFTGAAIKIAKDRGWCMWWEPERDGKKVYCDDKMVRYVKSVIEEGYAFVSVGLYGPAADRFGIKHTVMLEAFGMGGVDWPGIFPGQKENTVKLAFKDLLPELASWVSRMEEEK